MCTTIEAPEADPITAETDFADVEAQRVIDTEHVFCEHPADWVSEEFGGPTERSGWGPTYYVCGWCGLNLGKTGRGDSVL